LAPGAGIATSDAGATAEGYPAFATVSGSSASTAVVAGAAALLAQARPELDEGELRSLLVTSAKPLANTSVAAQGAGALDLVAVEQISIAVRPHSLTFPLLRGRHKQATVELRLRNLGNAEHLVAASAHLANAKDWVRARVEPKRVLIEAGRHATLRVKVRLLDKHPGASAQGRVDLLLSSGKVLHVPWALRTAPRSRPSLIARATLLRKRFASSDSEPAILMLRLGRVTGKIEREIEPVKEVDVELRNADGRFLGVLARLRDVLPGHYVFGLTGRDPAGATLPPGSYRLRIVALPSGGGARSVRSLRFVITPAKKA
jgi:hypothetical protein